MDIAKFMLEIGSLKKLKRTGWLIAGVKDPETIAEHSFRALVLGYILAKMEGADADKVIKMMAFHDIPEARLSDMNKVTQNYVDPSDSEERVIEDQSELLPDSIRHEYKELLREFNEKKTKEAVVARDADSLELAIQAHEYMQTGIRSAEDWLQRSGGRLQTHSAQKILEDVLKSDYWWHGLKKP